LAIKYLPEGSRYGEMRRDNEQGILRDQVIDNEIILLGGKTSGFNLTCTSFFKSFIN
jgi:hypothetical protein